VSRGQRGSLAVEAAIVLPAILLLFSLVLIAGMAEQTGGSVEAAARAGARAGSLERHGSVQEAATKAVDDWLANAGVHCAKKHVTVVVEQLTDPTGALPPPAVPLNVVVVNVSCTVPVNDWSPVRVPGEWTLNGAFRSVVDRYRAG
jgi:hypothetical protein